MGGQQACLPRRESRLPRRYCASGGVAAVVKRRLIARLDVPLPGRAMQRRARRAAARAIASSRRPASSVPRANPMTSQEASVSVERRLGRPVQRTHVDMGAASLGVGVVVVESGAKWDGWRRQAGQRGHAEGGPRRARQGGGQEG